MTSRLKRLAVRGFRSLRDIEINDIGPATVMIGPNGAGKSNLLTVLKLFPLLRTQSLRNFVAEQGGASKILHYGPQITPQVELTVEFQDEVSKTWAYHARLGYAAGDAFIFLDEQARYRPEVGSEFKPASLGAGHTESRLREEADRAVDYTIDNTHRLLKEMSFFHFHETGSRASLRQNAKQSDAYYLRSDGSNLAAYLFALSKSSHEEDRKAWLRIELTVRRFAPFIKRLEPMLVDPASPETSTVRLHWVDERDHLFDVHDLSDGTLRAIALVVALSQPARNLPSFICIDEPELGLHPAALNVLVGLIRSAQSRCQVLLATQSPALLDHFSPEEVLVCERHEGATTIRGLDSDPLQDWLDDYRLSELYDKNLLGGRP